MLVGGARWLGGGWFGSGLPELPLPAWDSNTFGIDYVLVHLVPQVFEEGGLWKEIIVYSICMYIHSFAHGRIIA